MQQCLDFFRTDAATWVYGVITFVVAVLTAMYISNSNWEKEQAWDHLLTVEPKWLGWTHLTFVMAMTMAAQFFFIFSIVGETPMTLIIINVTVVSIIGTGAAIVSKPLIRFFDKWWY